MVMKYPLSLRPYRQYRRLDRRCYSRALPGFDVGGVSSMYSHDEESAEDQEENGWKYIHGDVFRFPDHKSLFSIVLGSGTQLLAL
ncbi:hypothetical protein Taro_009930 [Colocasia esculenta]|uniref:Transmembrane 9 superfamily member n=1 Tax=Colocasia esculenta TaxID=4460 RepID=A0A843U696_COLES|nr:hypothetical protein [Colocasia esculenta]